MIAESKPDFIHSFKKTELSVTLAAGFKPKLTLEIPRIKCTCGCRSFINLIALIVSTPFFLSSYSPVDIGNANGS